jgi:hypothetical protein
MEDALPIVGGVIPGVDEDALLKMDVKKVFCGLLVGGCDGLSQPVLRTR